MSDKKDEREEAKGGATAQSQESAGEESEMSILQQLLSRFTLHNRQTGDPVAEPEARSKPEQLLEELTVEGVAKFIKSGKCKNVIVMSGAGISTSAGIPDFRSPGSGLYDNLQKYNVPTPQAIFEIGYFKEHPEPFFALSKELFPGKYYPTPCHNFIRLLSDKKILLRHYTQNIDTLDRRAGVPDERIMEAHGSYHTGHCLNESCREEYTDEWMKAKIDADLVPKCTKCEEVVKPDIVFFGESLPPKFFPLVQQDFPKCDLLLIMGTSLVVQPFASLVDRVPETTPRLLINKEKTGKVDPLMMLFGMSGGMDFDSENRYRDVAYIGTCDDGCTKLAELLGWKNEFDKLCQETSGKSTDSAKADSTKEDTASKDPKKGANAGSPKKETASKDSAKGADSNL